MAAGLPPSPALDTSIASGQTGHEDDHEVIHGTLALLKAAAGMTAAEIAADAAFTGTYGAPVLHPAYNTADDLPAASADNAGYLATVLDYDDTGAQLVRSNGSSWVLVGAPAGLAAVERALYLPGASGVFLTTPDHADLDIVGDIDLRADVALDSYAPAAPMTMVAKWDESTNQRSYRFRVQTNGILRYSFTTDGAAGTVVNIDSTVDIDTILTAGQRAWLRVVHDVDNGASGHDVRFYYSLDGGDSWTQLGTTVTTATATTIFAGTALGTIGAMRNAGTGDFLAGKVHRVQIISGIGGTPVADWRADYGMPYRDVTGKVWSTNGTGWAWSSAAA